MLEHQNTEYKQSWQEDYLKWIVGFANSGGGTSFIEKDNSRQVVAVPVCKM